ncbi:MAG TPA: TadE family type IV pilus minor pilin [Dermatophilaceae bacterium]|nr:TadE family type IV pilus minor pilin [Dermatophilaceae bacterium]
MATAELAVAMPALVVVLALALGCVRVGIDHVRCVDAARAGVRLLARGEPAPAALAEARGLAPAGATVAAGSSGDLVTVEVVGRAPAVLGWLGTGLTPAAIAHSRIEARLGEEP